MKYPIVDLHCDLLCYLAKDPKRSPNDSLPRCSYPDLQKGHVALQTLAIFTETKPHSTQQTYKQAEIFRSLEPLFPSFSNQELSTKTQVIASIENASGFAEESEPLSQSFKHLEKLLDILGRVLYISLTWNTENRFGGGNETKVGLKEDGKRLLEFLHGKQIAIDFSHTSDYLAHDILNWVDKQGLDIPLLASHSNFRAVCNQLRNLPEEIAKELIRRQALIGMNFVAPFIHETDVSVLARHVEYALSLGAESCLCFGADFFCDHDDRDAFQKKYRREELFYPELKNASCYPFAIHLLQERIGLSSSLLEKICFGNALHYFKKNIYITS